MVSELESKVRKLDNKNKSITESARRITLQLELREGTIMNYILAKRAGFSSFSEWRKDRLKKRGFHGWTDYFNYLAKKSGLKDYKELINRAYIKTGFWGRADYNNYLYHKKIGHVKDKEEYFEGAWKDKLNLKYKSNESLDKIPTERDFSLIGILKNADKKEEIKSLLDKIIGNLPERYQRIIRGRFYEGKSYAKIGKELKISRERVRQIESKAIRKLYHPAKQSLYELYTEKYQ